MRPDVSDFLDNLPDPSSRDDSLALVKLMEESSGEETRLWNGNTIGVGQYHYRYASGQEGEFFKIGFSPRGANITIYVMSGLRGFDDILGRLGRHKASKSTVKIRKLEDVDTAALSDLIGECVRHLDKVANDLGAIPRMSEIPPRQLR